MKSLIGSPVFYWYSASEVSSGIFVRWCVTKMHTGGEDTDKMGVGAIIEVSDWMASVHRGDRGLPRNQHRLRPYWDLYRSYDDARVCRNKIRRPTLQTLRDPKYLQAELRASEIVINKLNRKIEEQKTALGLLETRLTAVPAEIKLKQITVWVKDE